MIVAAARLPAMIRSNTCRNDHRPITLDALLPPVPHRRAHPGEGSRCHRIPRATERGLQFEGSVIYSRNGMVDAISPRGYVTVAQAAERLDVSARRVHQLVATGDLPSSRLGATIVIPEADVERRLALAPADGRRLTPPNAWALLLLASGERAAWLTPDTRFRLRRLLAKHGLMAMRARLAERGTARGFRAHPSVLRGLRDDPALMLSGVAAAGALRLGLLAGDRVDAYVDERALAGMVAHYGLLASQDPNVILRAVPPFLPSWPLSHVAPTAAVALDLLEDDDPRSRQVGQDLLDRLTS